MKRILLTVVFICSLFFNTSQAQETWYANWVLNNGPNPPNLYGVCVHDYFCALSCGSGGYISHYVQYVEDVWMPVVYPPITNKNLNSIIIVDSSNVHKAYCVGESGKILKSNLVQPNSMTFYFQNSPTTRGLNSLYFINYSMGMAVGDTGTVIRTTDGGGHWNVLPAGTLNSLYSLNFPSTNTGYAVGVSGIVLKTTDFGNNWTTKTAPVNDTLRSVWFTSDNTGFVVSRNGALYKTTDGGTTWQSKPSTTTENLNAICFGTLNIGFASGNNNKVIKTTNAGETWANVTLPPLFHNGHFKALNINSSGALIATVGTNGTAASTMTDGGNIMEYKCNNDLFISPCPAKDYIIIRTNNNTTFKQVEIYNSCGAKIMKTMLQLREEMKIDISNLPAGFYFVTVSDEKGITGKGKYTKQ